MALFGRKKKEDVKKEAPAAAAPVAPAKAEKAEKKAPVKASAKEKPSKNIDAGSILLRPRITEKAAILSEKGVYAFDVAQSATKREVKLAVAKVFNVTPVKVRMLSIKEKQVVTRSTGKSGRKPGGKKAYVELKAGEKIELI